MWIPHQDILEEGSAAEIGFTLEDDAGHKVERMSIAQGHVASVSIPDYLKVMLEIPGRFDDPKRDVAVEMDGIRFDEFLQGKNRREFITKWLNEHPALKEAANEPNADLKTSDIIKGWFIIHDVGAKATLKDRRFKANQPKTKGGAVRRYLNRAGYYAATHDFTKNQPGHRLFNYLARDGKKYVNEHTINIETVPDVESDVPDKSDASRGDPSNVDQYTSMGYRRKGKKVTYYKWTKAAIDVLADLLSLRLSPRATPAHNHGPQGNGPQPGPVSHLAGILGGGGIRTGTGKHGTKFGTTPTTTMVTRTASICRPCMT